MANSRLSFAAAVEGWAEETKEKVVKVFREAATDLIEVANEVGPSVTNPDSTGTGSMPVATGFLRNSAVMVINGPIPPATRKNPNPKAKYAYEPSYEAIILGADLGDTISVGWTAEYAPHIEYGTSKIPARGFVRKAAQQWQAIVDRAVARHRD